jgi:hypothetical protein
MSERKINLEQILISKLKENSTEDFDLQIISKLHFIACYYVMEEACKQVLELAVENAECYDEHDGTGHWSIDKQSILNTIKQVE